MLCKGNTSENALAPRQIRQTRRFRAELSAHLLVYRQHLLLLMLLLLLGRLNGSHCVRLCLQLLCRGLCLTLTHKHGIPNAT